MPKDIALQNSMDKFWLENVSKIKVETELARLPQLSLDPEQIRPSPRQSLQERN